LYQLLLELRNLTGNGIILNTSLNLSGEPLVETPQQAVDILANSELDYVWLPETMQLIS
jgi:carbamoyltransferase